MFIGPSSKSVFLYQNPRFISHIKVKFIFIFPIVDNCIRCDYSISIFLTRSFKCLHRVLNYRFVWWLYARRCLTKGAPVFTRPMSICHSLTAISCSKNSVTIHVFSHGVRLLRQLCANTRLVFINSVNYSLFTNDCVNLKKHTSALPHCISRTN